MNTRMAVAVLNLALFASLAAKGQQITNQNNIGLPLNAVFGGSEFDSVQLNNGNLHIESPLWSAEGRGLDTSFKYVYDNKGWYLREACGRYTCRYYATPEFGNNMQWRMAAPTAYRVRWDWIVQECDPGFSYVTYTNYILQEPDGTKHHFRPDPAKTGFATGGCSALGNLYADDGSGWMLQVNNSDATLIQAIAPNGAVVKTNYDPNNQWATDGVLVQDSNGN
ncbi:MAG TPA: hypothetical protein VGQ71_14440, partial [Terriglobales bacterium]|nr:hypothetical protein [Terriglobales bacterium]